MQKRLKKLLAQVCLCTLFWDTYNYLNYDVSTLVDLRLLFYYLRPLSIHLLSEVSADY